MTVPCSGGLETTSGASFVDACEEAVLSPEVLPNVSDCNQQKRVGLVVEFSLELADSAKPVGSMGYVRCQLTKTLKGQNTVRSQTMT